MKRSWPRRIFALSLIGSLAVLGCANGRCPASPEGEEGIPQASRPAPSHADIATAPLPAAAGLASTALVEAWRLSDALVATAVESDSSPDTEADLRQWAIDGFMPRERVKKALFLRAMLSLGAAGSQSTEEQAIAAALTGRMEESFASDWSGLHAIECVADPTVCRWASVVIANAKRAWFERAVERYEACADLARDERVAAWARFCGDRIAMIRGLSVMRAGGATRP